MNAASRGSSTRKAARTRWKPLSSRTSGPERSQRTRGCFQCRRLHQAIFISWHSG